MDEELRRHFPGCPITRTTSEVYVRKQTKVSLHIALHYFFTADKEQKLENCFNIIVLVPFNRLHAVNFMRACTHTPSDFATAYIHMGLRVPGVLARKRWNFYTLNSALL